jgi:hypothetical protein
VKSKRFVAIILIIILIGTFFIIKNNSSAAGLINNVINKSEGKALNRNFTTKIKSGNLSTDYTIEDALSDINKFGFNTVNVPVVINIEDLSSNTMTVDKESKRKAIELIKDLKGKRINIILEPYPWIANGSKYETDWNPTDINTFFWNWKTNVLKVLINDVAVPYHVDALNIGTGFNHMEYAEGYWCDTVDYVRKDYKGLVTYRSSWWFTADWAKDTIKQYETKLNNKLFSKLDFISIAAYFELTNNDTNSIENLVSTLQSTQTLERKQNVKQEIKNFYDKWNKPIFFGELGFPKTIKASVHPWNPYQSNIVNNVEQANCFEAYRRTFENEPWMLGFSVFAVGEHSDDKRYYPSDESAVVIKNWYSNSKK